MLDQVLPEPKHKRIAGEDDAIIKLAVLAVGGQGGGVLADWIVFPPEIIQHAIWLYLRAEGEDQDFPELFQPPEITMQWLNEAEASRCKNLVRRSHRIAPPHARLTWSAPCCSGRGCDRKPKEGIRIAALP